jgi:hypothetical protein
MEARDYQELKIFCLFAAPDVTVVGKLLHQQALNLQ